MHHRPTTRVGLLSVVAASLLVAACTGSAATTGASTGALAAPVAELTATSPAVAAEAHDDTDDEEGIHVNGDWEVVVRDRDGSVASETAFHNDLTEDGALALARLAVIPETSLDETFIRVREGDLCGDPEAVTCEVPTTASVDVTTQDATLTGGLVASVDGSIRLVQTVVAYDVGPTSGRVSALTERVLDTPVTFVEGQTVEITVTLSFS